MTCAAFVVMGELAAVLKAAEPAAEISAAAQARRRI
jgi:hypothetical protein